MSDEVRKMAEKSKFKQASWNERTAQVHKAWCDTFNPQTSLASTGDYPIANIYDDHVIVEIPPDYFVYTYTVDDGGEFKFSEPEKIDYAPTEKTAELPDDMLIAHGGGIKALGGGRVGGHLVLFGSPTELDTDGQFFTAKTDFDFDDGDRATVYFHHGIDPVVRKRKLGRGLMKRDQFGIWIEAQLELRDQYEKWIYERASVGKMGWSSGTAPNLVEFEAAERGEWIKSWPLGLDATITPTPADPRNRVMQIKAYQAACKAAGFESIASFTEPAEGLDSEGGDSKRLAIVQAKLNLLRLIGGK